MSIYDLIQRTEAILKKYEKYDATIKPKGKSDDPFTEEYDEVEAEVERLYEAAAEVSLEQNRAVIAAKNAEIRRAKNVLLTEAIQALEKKVKKGKGVTKVIIKERQEKVKELIEKIYAVPDGMSSGVRRPQRHGAKGTKRDPIMLNGSNVNGSSSQAGWYDNTEETQKFETEWSTAKKRQDEQLDRIGQVVDNLGNMAKDMQEEIDKQAPVIDDVEQQINKVTSQLKTNNAKLKAVVHQVRNARSFCIDVILIVVLLSIAAYIYAMYAN